MLIDTIKTSIRITGNDLDDDIQQNIDACIAEMERVGIVIPSEITDAPLIVKSIEMFVKWQYDYIGKGEQYEKNYYSLRDALSLCAKYTTEVAANDE